ncbi:group 1 truncated hemoglobin [Phenylobacterium aquaticum]|uniref:group I truncated hemoglobin n=1 Tax=Phenylobacterium aquaticum TaxID=1763816 RepID=UPI0026EDC0CC|nr:group 1 truncated hemoglobin [Phenylobacterium aquaticum]
MTRLIPTLIAAAGLAWSASALAAEKPVDPYTVSNTNADAQPFTGEQMLAAFHGQAGVARVVDGMVDLSVADPRTAEIFHATDLERLRRTLKEQFDYLLGAGVNYTGRDMKTVHKDQGINTAEFNALVENLQKAMDKEGVAFRAQNQLLAKLAPMKGDVVTR